MIKASRRTLTIVLIAICIVWATWFGVRFFLRHSGKSDLKEIEITNEIDLKLNTNVANIFVFPSESNTLQIESKRAGLIEVLYSKEAITVTVDDDRSRAERTIFMGVPRGIKNLKIRTSVGNIDITDISNNSIQLDTSTGNVVVHDIKAEKLLLKSSVGNMDISEVDANEVDARTSTGNIDIEEVSADVLIAKTSIGNVTLNADRINSIDLSTGTGDIYISLEEERGTFSVETSTIIDAYIFGNNVGSKQENLVYGTGGPTVRVKNNLGSIEIR